MKSTFLFFFVVIFSLANSQTIWLPKYDEENNKWQYVDTNDNVVLSLDKINATTVQFFTEGLAPFQDNNSKLWGYIDEKGNIKISAQFEAADFFIDGYAIVRKECKKNCYQGNEGLLNNQIGYIIDKSGKTIFTDNSQDSRPYARYFLHENLGKGFFSIYRGIGLGERQDFINFKGDVLGETTISYGKGGLFWDEEMKAIKCGSKYFDAKGNVVLDLTEIGRVYSEFSEGYVWASVEVETAQDEFSSFYYLIDKKGKVIVKLNQESYGSVGQVKNGEFTVIDLKEDIVYNYSIATQKMTKIEFNNTILYEENYGAKLKDGSRIIYDYDYQEIIGILLKNGQKYYLEETY